MKEDQIMNRLHKKFHLIATVLVAATIFLISCSALENPVIDPIPVDYYNHLVAHRGVWGKNGNNENSYKAVLAAAELGFWGAEIDIHETSDGQYILNHDSSIFGLDIAASTLEDFKKYQFPNGDTITTLNQIMEILRLYSDFHLQIEVKAGDAKKISKIISDSDAEQQVVIISFDINICFDFLENTNLPVMLLCSNKQEFDAKKLKQAGFWGVDMYYHVCLQSDSVLNDCHEQGLKLCVWASHNINEIAWFLSKGIDFITTDSIEGITYDELTNCIGK